MIIVYSKGKANKNYHQPVIKSGIKRVQNCQMFTEVHKATEKVKVSLGTRESYLKPVTQ